MLSTHQRLSSGSVGRVCEPVSPLSSGVMFQPWSKLYKLTNSARDSYLCANVTIFPSFSRQPLLSCWGFSFCFFCFFLVGSLHKTEDHRPPLCGHLTTSSHGSADAADQNRGWSNRLLLFFFSFFFSSLSRTTRQKVSSRPVHAELWPLRCGLFFCAPPASLTLFLRGWAVLWHLPAPPQIWLPLLAPCVFLRYYS